MDAVESQDVKIALHESINVITVYASEWFSNEFHIAIRIKDIFPFPCTYSSVIRRVESSPIDRRATFDDWRSTGASRHEIEADISIEWPFIGGENDPIVGPGTWSSLGRAEGDEVAITDVPVVAEIVVEVELLCWIGRVRRTAWTNELICGYVP